jgi:hypothetical protein
MHDTSVVNGRRNGLSDGLVLQEKKENTLKGLIKNIQIDFISLVKKGANQKEIIFKSRDAFTKTIEIKKIDKEKQMVYGVVYSPEEEDSQGQFTTVEEIEKAAEKFMKAGKTAMVDKNHDEQAGQGFIKESWIKKDIEPLFPDEKNGSWIVGIKVENENTWEEIKKGEITGLSMQGIANVLTGDALGVKKEEAQEANLQHETILEKIRKKFASVKKSFNEDFEKSQFRTLVMTFFDSCINAYYDGSINDEALIPAIQTNYSQFIAKAKEMGFPAEEVKKMQEDATPPKEETEDIAKKYNEELKLAVERIEKLEKTVQGTKQILDVPSNDKRLSWNWL